MSTGSRRPDDSLENRERATCRLPLDPVAHVPDGEY